MTFSDWCFGFVLGLFSWFGGYPGVSERAFYPLFVRGKGQVCGCWGFGAVLGEFLFLLKRVGFRGGLLVLRASLPGEYVARNDLR